jgi:hypothetical protein
MSFRLEITPDENEEDTVGCVTGECPKCKRGENTLIIYKRQAHPNIREKAKGNALIFLQCIICKNHLMKDQLSLSSDEA